jgi:hypothetical protein
MICRKSCNYLNRNLGLTLSTIYEDDILKEKTSTETAPENERTNFPVKEIVTKNQERKDADESLFAITIDRVFITVVYSGAFTAFIGVIDENYPIIILGGAVVFACCAGMSYIERYQN